MILFHPCVGVLFVSLHHVVVWISVHDFLGGCPSGGTSFWSDEWCSAFADDESAILSGEVSAVCVDVSEIPEWFEEISELCDLMDVGFGAVEVDDGSPSHVDGGMEFHIFFGAVCSFYFLPGFVVLPDGKSSCIDGNVLSFFLKDIASCWLRCWR